MGYALSGSLQSSYSETPAVAFQGQLVRKGRILPGKNAEASASMPFGTAVAFKPSGATSDFDVTLPANSNDQIKGLTLRTDSYAPAWTADGGTFGELDSTGIKTGVFMDLLHEGIAWVPCVTGCAPGDRLFVCYATAGSTYTVLGTMGNAAESSHTIDCTKQGEWLTTAAANGLAMLEVNFAAKA